MTRDLGTLADTTFDILVIGAGIYGAAAAWDAALRGYSVALIDRGDFGGATSANSLKTIHGGLRSLQRAALGDMRQFIRERRALLRIAPHLARPLRYVVPTSWRHPTRNPAAMRVALLLNDLIAADRNDGLAPAQCLPGGSLLSHDELARLVPDLDPRSFGGGASWWDAQMRNSERLTLAFAMSAARRGAAVANHVEATGFLREASRVTGASVRDVETGSAFDIRARVTINAAGAWAAGLSTAVMGRRLEAHAPVLSRALNVVVPRPTTDQEPAAGGTSDGRFFFRVPWRGLTMFGTSHEPFAGPIGDSRPTTAAVERLLADVNRAFPGRPVSLGEVGLVHVGILPAARISGDHVDLLKDSVLRDHRADGVDGLVTLIGVRYTTARHSGARAVDLASTQLGRATASTSATTPLVGGDDFDADRVAARVSSAMPGADPADVSRLVHSYGTDVGRVTARVVADPALAHHLSPDCRVWRAEVVHAAVDEMALTLQDALVRRTEAGSAAYPGDVAVGEAARLMAAIRGWTTERTVRERDLVRSYYALADATTT